MKFQTTRNDLLNKLNFASRIATSKSLISALSGVLIEASDNLSLYSTDLETSMKAVIPGNIIEKGRAVVPAKVFINILRNFPEAKIDLELDINTNQLKVQCEKSVFYLNTFPIDEYPEFPSTKEKIKFSIDFDIFKRLANKVIRATSGEESRAILTGVLIEINKSSENSNSFLLKMVGTDSYRLAFVEHLIDYSGEPIKVIVPSRVLDNLFKSDFTGKTIDLNIEENQITFNMQEDEKSNIMIISRLLSGKFPEYSQLIPKEFKHNMILEKEKVLEVIRRISSIAQDNIPIKIEFKNGKMMASMNIKEIGSSIEEIDVSYAQENLDIAFNPVFLIDGIAMIETDNFLFSIEETLKPVLIKNVNDDNLQYLLMPIRIS